MIVLKIIGWVLLGILALIVLALCVRVRIAVEYSDDNTNVLLQWLFIKLPLYPKEEKQPKQSKPKKEKAKKEKPEKKSGPPDGADAPPETSAGQTAQDAPAQAAPAEKPAQDEAAPATDAEKPAQDEDAPAAPSDEPAEAAPPVADQSASGRETVAGTAPPEAGPEEASAAESAVKEPAEEKAEPGEEAKQPESETKPAAKKESLLHMIYRTHGVDGILELVRRVFSYLGSFMGDMMGALVIEELYLDIGCTKKDAAATAIYYGEVCSALFPMLGALASKYKIKKYDINVYPDYLARFRRASFFVKFHLYPIYLIGITVVFGCRMLFKVLLRMLLKIFLQKKDKSAEKQNIKQKEKEDESHEGAVSGRNPVNND